MLGCAGGPREGEPWQRTGRLQTSGQNFPRRSLGSQWMGIALAPQGTGDSFGTQLGEHWSFTSALLLASHPKHTQTNNEIQSEPLWPSCCPPVLLQTPRSSAMGKQGSSCPLCFAPWLKPALLLPNQRLTFSGTPADLLRPQIKLSVSPG